MLHQTLSKGWCRDGSGLLLGLIVRARGRLVEARARSSQPPKTGRPALLTDSEVIDPGHPRPVAPLPQREGLLALRFLSPALLLPEPLLPEPVQPAGYEPWSPSCAPCSGPSPEELAEPSAVYRVLDTTLVPAMVRVRASRKGLFCGQATFGQERLQDRVGLRLQGGAGGRSRGRGKRLRAGPGGLRRETHRGGPHSRRPSRSLPGRQRALRGSSGSGAGWRSTGRWWPPPRTTTPAGHGRRPIDAGPPASARSSRG